MSLVWFQTLEFLFEAKSAKLPDNESKIAVLLLGPAPLFRDEPLEMMEDHAAKDSALRMTRAKNSGHIGYEEIRNTLETGKGQIPEMASVHQNKQWRGSLIPPADKIKALAN